MAGASRLIFIVEEPSMEAFLHALLPRWMPPGRSFEVHAFQGKDDLLGKLEARLRGYAAWLPDDCRLFVIVDRDAEACTTLKQRMESIAARAGVLTRTASPEKSAWQLVNRIAIEELEAWYFGDWAAVQAAYPRASDTVPRSRRFRDPDAITGGTWEAFEEVMQRHGYFKPGLAKIEAARQVGRQVDAARSKSPSFIALHAAVAEAVQAVPQSA